MNRNVEQQDEPLTIADYLQALGAAKMALEEGLETVSLGNEMIADQIMPTILGFFEMPQGDDLNHLEGNTLPEYMGSLIEHWEILPKTKNELAEKIVSKVQKTYQLLTSPSDLDVSDDTMDSRNQANLYEEQADIEACLTLVNDIAKAVFKSLGHRYTARYDAQLPSPLNRGG